MKMIQTVIHEKSKKDRELLISNVPDKMCTLLRAIVNVHEATGLESAKKLKLSSSIR